MKTVQSGAHYTTVTVDTAEAVKFSFPSTSLSVEAAGGDITVALTDTAQAGDDETITVPDGESRMFIHHRMNVDTYYLTGSGTANLYASNMGDVNPFKGKSKGGDGGGDNTHYKGTTTTPISNGSTTNPIVIDGESYTAVFGDVVVYGYTEFVFDGTTWAEFGRPFDTVPTSGSTNAVTSDGIYKRTPFVRAGLNGTGAALGSSSSSGEHSVAIGTETKATAKDAFTAGYYATASGAYSSAFGFVSEAVANYSHAYGNHTKASGKQSCAAGLFTTASGDSSHAGGSYTIANKPASTAIGKYNVADTNVAHLLIVGNGTSAARSNILEVSETDMNVNGDIQQNGVPIRATTMPTITASMLGKVVQYIGASDSNYKQGWNYVAVSDGAEPPTYSWQALMDTTPTSGSTNAVTSDGVYQRTPWRRGSGLNSATGGTSTNAAVGENAISYGKGCQARGRHCQAFGYETVAGQSSDIANYATTFGYQTAAIYPFLTAIGKANMPHENDLFNIGNGTSVSARSNIVEVNHTSANVNGDIKINNVSIPIPYTTMPTITADMLGKIAMYVGATGGGFTQGCFYVASTDGAAEPTYSWVKIGGGYKETTLYLNEGQTTPETITLTESFRNYDALEFVAKYYNATGTVFINEHPLIVTTSSLITGESLSIIQTSASSYCTYWITDNTHFAKHDVQGFYLYSIKGIKY